MKRYIEASPKARLVFFLLALLLTVLVAILQRVDEWFPMKGISLEQFPDRALLYLLIDVVFYLLLSGVVVFYAIRTVRSRQWPPHGHPVPFRTQVTEIKKPIMVWVYAGFILVIFMAQITMDVNGWFRYNKLIQEIILETSNE